MFKINFIFKILISLINIARPGKYLSRIILKLIHFIFINSNKFNTPLNLIECRNLNNYEGLVLTILNEGNIGYDKLFVYLYYTLLNDKTFLSYGNYKRQQYMGKEYSLFMEIFNASKGYFK